MINVTSPSLLRSTRTAPRAYRLTPGAFWLFYAAEAVLIVLVLAAILGAIPSATPLTETQKLDTVRAAILSRLDGALSDPQIEVAPGILARSSQVRGIEFEGTIYYYYFEGQRSFDPLSRGMATPEQIELLLREEGGAAPLVIYRLIPGKA